MKPFYPPRYPYSISQYFGENKACYQIVNGKVVVIGKEQDAQCPVGYQSLYSQMLGHNGIDIPAMHGSPLFASCDGYVVEVQTEEARGLGIGILTDIKYPCIETNKDEYFKLRYWHLISINVKLGQYVAKGDFIGLADNTGYSSGDHCHFEGKPVTFTMGSNQAKDTDLTNILQDDGYLGAVNLLPYIDTPIIPTSAMSYGESSLDIIQLQFILKYLGYFPKEQTVTGYYGNITKSAVFAYQQQYISLSFYERNIMKGSRVGDKTLVSLNNLLK